VTAVETAPAAPTTQNLATFVQEDPTYLHVSRKMRGTCTREQWRDHVYRQEALDRWWKVAIEGLRSRGYDFVVERPVTLYRSPRSGAVLYADIRQTIAGAPHLIWPDGKACLLPPQGPVVIQRTSYRKWAEGPLPHIELDLLPAKTPDDDDDVQRVRAQNRALREAIDAALALNPAQWSGMAQTVRADLDLVDFVIRGIFRRADYQPLRSLQTQSHAKLRLPDGTVVDADDINANSQESL
jgi:hypothetical protein